MSAAIESNENNNQEAPTVAYQYSLLDIHDGPLRIVIQFLNAKELGVLEKTCKTLHELTGDQWKALDAGKTIGQYPYGEDKDRIVPWHRAQAYAHSKMLALEEGLSAKYKRVIESWNMHAFKKPQQYNYFVVIWRTSRRKPMWEGFVPMSAVTEMDEMFVTSDERICLDLSVVLDSALQHWSSMRKALQRLDTYPRDHNLFRKMMPHFVKALRHSLVSVTAVPKTREPGKFKRRSLRLVCGTGGYYKMETIGPHAVHLYTRQMIHKNRSYNLTTYFEFKNNLREGRDAPPRLVMRIRDPKQMQEDWAEGW
jgi:hypothetical protein